MTTMTLKLFQFLEAEGNSKGAELYKMAFEAISFLVFGLLLLGSVKAVILFKYIELKEKFQDIVKAINVIQSKQLDKKWGKVKRLFQDQKMKNSNFAAYCHSIFLIWKVTF